MAIVKMKRLAVVGLNHERESLMQELMDFGVCEISDQTDLLTSSEYTNLIHQDVSPEIIAKLDSMMDKASTALEILEKYGKSGMSLLSSRRKVTKAELFEIEKKKDETELFVEKVISLNSKIQKDNDAINKLEQDRAFLKRWENFSLPLDKTSTKKTKVITGFLPTIESSYDLESFISDKAASMSIVSEEKNAIYIACIIYENSEEILNKLKELNFTEISFKGYFGTAKENLDRISDEEENLNLSISNTKDKLTECALNKNDIENYYDLLSINLTREKIKENLIETKSTFLIVGWVPEKRMEDCRMILDRNGCYYVFRDPNDDEQVPVLLKNSDFFTPVEAVTEMYSLPDYKGFDPTSIYGLFYILFFGMMFGDAGYGLILIVGCSLALKLFDLEGTTKKLIKLFLYSGVSTLIFGLLFGSFFGNIVEAFSSTFLSKTVTLDAFWFNPLDNPMLLLGISLVLGVIHLFTAMGIEAYMQIKEGKIFDAICDEGFWYLTITGIMFLLGGSILSISWMPSVGKWMTIIGVLGLLLTGGRHKKGFGKVTGGLSNIYNITSWLSDILSYARILALGLATGVIGEVVNTMGSIFGGSIVGFILFALVFLVGHGINFAINALGSFIHAARLQYVEFFGKFYIDGGEPFNPYRIKTKYIKIMEE